MSITTDYEVFSERYHIPSEMDRRQRANDKIASLEGQVLALQASEAKLMDEASGEGGDDLVYENEKLKAEIEGLKKAKIIVARASFDEKVREVTEHMKEAVNTMGKENEKLKGENRRLGFAVIGADEENKKLTAEIEGLKDFTNWENHPALKHKVVLDDDYYLEITQEKDDLEAEVEKLFKFITGGTPVQDLSDVEEIIVEKMSKEFIDSNQEHWDQMELFQED